MSLLDKASLICTPNAVKAGKLYSIVPSSGAGDMDVVRATTATRVNSLGLIENVGLNVARLNYEGSCPSILIEPQRTNLRNLSEEILTPIYATNNSTLQKVSVPNPSDTLNASLFKLNSGANTGNTSEGFNFNGSILLTNTTQYTQYLFVKPFGASTFRIRNNSNGQLADFILIGAGTAPPITGSLQGATITSYTNGWYRVSWTFTATTSIPGNRSDAWQIKTNVADGINGIYVWGAQLEQGSYPTSYIQTVASTITRNADVITVSTPAGTVKITTTFSNDTTEIITAIPATYTAPIGKIKLILMQNTL